MAAVADRAAPTFRPEDTRESLGKSDLCKQAPRSGPRGAGKVHDVRIERFESRDAADDNRKKREKEHEEQLRSEAEPEPDEKQGSDRDLRDDLKKDDHGIDRLFHEPRTGDREGKRDAHGNSKRIPGENLMGCHERA